MKSKTPKRYPMDGPNLEIQRLMERPRENRQRLKQYFADRKNMRPETTAILNLP